MNVPADHNDSRLQGLRAALRDFAKQWSLPLLAFCYVLVFVLIDSFVDNINRYYIFINLLIVSSLWFSWYLGGKETMLYVAFFNIFFAFIFARIIYLSNVISAPLFLGKSFLVMYFFVIVFMVIMMVKKSPADQKREQRMQYIQEEQSRRRHLEMMVATQKLTHDLTKQANRVKDELLLLQNAWRSQIHSIVNDLTPGEERELYEKIVKPFQEDIIRHLRDLNYRLSFNPQPTSLRTLHAWLLSKLDSEKKFKRGNVIIAVEDHGWAGSDKLVDLDSYKTWEIVINLIRNSQAAMEIKQIELLRSDKKAFAAFRPRIEVCFGFLDAETAFIRVVDNGGGVADDLLPLLFREPMPSKKRGGKSFGQGTIFVKFFGESMGFSISTRNTDMLGEKGLLVDITIPLQKPEPA